MVHKSWTLHQPLYQKLRNSPEKLSVDTILYKLYQKVHQKGIPTIIQKPSNGFLAVVVVEYFPKQNLEKTKLFISL